MWAIRLLDRKNGIKMYSDEMSHLSLIVFSSCGTNTLLFDTRSQARAYLANSKRIGLAEWARRQRDGLTSTVVPMTVTVEERV